MCRRSVVLFLSLVLILVLGGVGFTKLPNAQAAEGNQGGIAEEVGNDLAGAAAVTSVKSMVEHEVDLYKNANIIMENRGYRYVSSGDNLGGGYVAEGNAIENGMSGVRGTDKSVSEMIVKSWDEAELYLNGDVLSLLNNSYLNSLTDQLSISIMEDSVTVYYLDMDCEVSIHLASAGEPGTGQFEYGRYFPSDLYNLYQVERDQGDYWQCFSYRGYDEEEYSSAVLPRGDKVCEVVFQNSDQVFILKVLSEIESE